MLFLRVLLVFLAFAYFITSAVVLVNAFVWLPSFPSAWYEMQDILYWPFQPYFSLALRVLGDPSIPYSTYAITTRAPILLMAAGIAVILLRYRGRKAGD